MSGHEPEYVWVFPPDKRRTRRRIWLIVVLVIAAVAIATTLFAVFLPRTDPSATPSPSPSTSPSATPTAPVTPSPSPSPSVPAPTPTVGPVTPPPPVDPALPVFRDKVGPVLDDADTGLGFASGSSGQDAVQIVEQLQQDAQRLSDAVAPGSIADQWRTVVADYQAALSDLRSAYESGGSPTAALDSAQSAVAALRALIAG
ncbi:MAG: hypothetical protein WA971_16085 [Microbacterium sp.]